MTRRMFALLVALGLVPVAATRAEEGPPLAPGTRIRLEVPASDRELMGLGQYEPRLGRRTLVGTLLAVDQQNLTLQTAGRKTPIVVPLADVLKLEASRGRRSGLKRAAVGAVLGGGLGAASGVLEPESFVNPYVVGACFGAALGALIGSATGGDLWEKVPSGRPSVRVGVGVEPRGGARIGVSVSF